MFGVGIATKMGMGVGGGVKRAINYSSPESLSAMTGIGDLYDMSYSNRLTEIEGARSDYLANGYGTTERETLGLYSDGEADTPQFGYIFTPTATPERTLLVTGLIHSSEKYAGYSLIAFMKLLSSEASASDSLFLTRLREKYRFVFIPVVNITGVYANTNGVNLNRNFDINWGDQYAYAEGAYPNSEIETSNVITWVKGLLEDYSIDAAIDLHTFNGVGTDWFYMPAANFNNIAINRFVGMLNRLISQNGLSGNYITKQPYLVSGGCMGYYFEANLNIPAIMIEIRSAALTEATDPMGYYGTVTGGNYAIDHSKAITRGVEQILSCAKAFDYHFVKIAEETDWYFPLTSIACDSWEHGFLINKNANGSLFKASMTYAQMFIANVVNADPEVTIDAPLYNKGETIEEAYSVTISGTPTSIKKISRGNPVMDKKVLIVGVSNEAHDYLTITRVLAEIDKYAANTRIAGLLAYSNITLIPTANPTNRPISNWGATSSDAEAVALRAHIASEAYDYVIAIASPTTDQTSTVTKKTTICANASNIPSSLPMMINGVSYLGESEASATSRLTHTITGATIEPNNTVVASDYYLPRVEHGDTLPMPWRHGDIRYSSLIRNHLAAIINLAAAWISENPGEEIVTEDPAATPTISPDAGTYDSAQTITITCATEGASIYYTTDGSTPNATKTLYEGTFTINSGKTVKAIAIKTGNANSEIASNAYVIRSIWECAVTTERYVNVRVNTNTTITSTGGTILRASSGGTDLTSMDLVANTITPVYFVSPTTGSIIFPAIENINYLSFVNVTALTVNINGMGLIHLYLQSTAAKVSGSITGLLLNYLLLTGITAGSITGVLTGNEMTRLYLSGMGTDITFGTTTWSANMTGIALLTTTEFTAANYRTIMIDTAAVAWTSTKTFTITTGTSPGYDDNETPPQLKTAYDTLKGKSSMTLTLPVTWKGGAYPNDFPA